LVKESGSSRIAVEGERITQPEDAGDHQPAFAAVVHDSVRQTYVREFSRLVPQNSELRIIRENRLRQAL
jgi:hypothetical protein